MSIALAGSNVASDITRQEKWEQYYRTLMTNVGAEAVRLTRKWLDTEARFKRSTGRMKMAFKFKQDPKQIRLYFDTNIAPYAINVVRGVRPHQMTYLVGARKRVPTGFAERKPGQLSPIPIDPSKRVFRWATEKGMHEGKWMHPGTKPKDVFGWVVGELRDVLRKQSTLAFKVMVTRT